MGIPDSLQGPQMPVSISHPAGQNAESQKSVRSLEYNLGLPSGWQSPEHLSLHTLSVAYHLQTEIRSIAGPQTQAL